MWRIDDMDLFYGSAGESRVRVGTHGRGMWESSLFDDSENGPVGVGVCNNLASLPYAESFRVWILVHGSRVGLTGKTGDAGLVQLLPLATGPSGAIDGNYYIHTESSFFASAQSQILISPCFDLTTLSNPEVSFYYHLYGVNIGSIDLEISIDGGAWTSIWNRAGNQGNQWFNETISLASYATSNSFRMRFNAVNGPSIRSDMALDGFALQTGSTPGLSCNTTVSLPYAESFESGLGDWVDATDDDFDWRRFQGFTTTPNTGPSSAPDGNFYIYTEASGKPNQNTRINSPCIDLNGSSLPEISFRYHMFGSQIGTLDLEVTTDGTNWTSIFNRSGNQGNIWHSATASLADYTSSTIQLRFNSTVGGDSGDIAIDDIAIGEEVACNAPTNYCIPTSTNSQLFHINSVSLAGLTHNTGNGAAAYEDNTAISFDLIPGANTNLSVSTQSFIQGRVRVWIDYNSNGFFGDPGEDIGNIVTSSVAIFNFAPPISANGCTRMRIRRSPRQAGACGHIDFSQTEDYLVDFGDVPCEPPSNYCGVSSDLQLAYITSVSLNATTHNSGNGGPAYEDNTDITFVLDPGVTATMTVNTEFAFFSPVRAWIDYNANGFFGDPGEDLGSIFTSNVANFSFTPPSTVTGCTRMRIRRSFSPAASCGHSQGGQTEDYLVDFRSSSSSSTSNIIALAENNNTLELNENTAVLETDNTAQLFRESILVSPNPANTNLNVQLVSTGGTVNLMMFDLNGRVVEQEKFNTHKGLNLLKFNFQTQADGLYLLQIDNGETKEFRKIFVQY